MLIAVVGGTGTLGGFLVRELTTRGHEVRVLSRHSPTHSVDLETGRGLKSALKGCNAVVDASDAGWGQRGKKTIVARTVRLLNVCRDVGLRHHVCISIVGCDRVPVGYYQAKFHQEQTVQQGTIPWTIVRSTQFHELLDSAFSRAADWGVLPTLQVPLQTVACVEVASAAADIVELDPRYEAIDVAGPEIITMPEMARIWRNLKKRRAKLFPIPLWGELNRRLRDGVLTKPEPDIRGKLSFDEWLRNRQGSTAR